MTALHALQKLRMEDLKSLCWDHPDQAAELILGFKLWSRQVEILKALRDHKQVAVRSANAVGKTRTAAVATILFLFSHRPSYVVTTSSSWRGVESVLWPELRYLYNHAPVPLGPPPMSTKWELEDKWGAVGLSTNEPENFAGYHNDAVLVIVDEASALDPEIMTAIQGITTGQRDRILMIGNPLRPSGPFYEAFKSSAWHTLHISALESPNVTEGREVIAGLATPEWIEARREEWGEESPAYIARVLGEFPDEEEDALVSLTALERAGKRPMPTLERWSLRMGVDVARFGGDRTVFVIRDTAAVRHVESHRGWTTVETAGRAKALIEEWGIVRTFVDDLGVGGGVTDVLKDMAAPGVVPVTVSNSAEDSRLFANLRAEAYWRLVKALETLAIPPKLVRSFLELASTHRQYSRQGQIQIEPKSEIKKRIGRSPDFADALMLTYATREWSKPGRVRSCGVLSNPELSRVLDAF